MLPACLSEVSCVGTDSALYCECMILLEQPTFSIEHPSRRERCRGPRMTLRGHPQRHPEAAHQWFHANDVVFISTTDDK